ncbi:asparaginyl-trna synthetase [Moniliophthora roreri]|uniref:Asparagine--tRNA ligase, mitochondrial n=1 Tax=Moniliophthora roreri TaxID=221103 RepID=A0A0W0GDN0_MONRR|nr:asparaginyl-trna synthetase [Moniliophthora roreri]
MLATSIRRSILAPTIRQLLSSPTLPSNEVTVTGFIKSIRRQKRVSFAVVSDGSNAKGLQAVFLGESGQAVLTELTNGASVRITGKLSKSLGAGQEHELVVSNAQVIGTCDSEIYPIQKQSLSTEFLRDNVHLRARTSNIGAMVRLRAALQRELHSWFDKNDFIHIHTPILTSNDAEGAGETFRITTARETPEKTLGSSNTQQKHEPSHFFNAPAHLTVSAQLHLEAFQHAISRVWTLSPAFRAERSDTSRHLAEFWMLEAEWSDTDARGVRGICAVVEDMLRGIIGGVLEKRKEDLHVLKSDTQTQTQTLEKAVSNSTPWPILTYTQAITSLSQYYDSKPFAFTFKPEWGKGLQSEHERWLAKDGPVFVVDYPAALKPFYMRVNDEGETVACFDLLIPGVGELVGGSVREEREDVLRRRMNECGLDAEGAYKWYLDLRRYGGAPHVGFGMGFERLISWVGGIDNVKECVPVPRWAGRMLL